jgi:putative addiction module component (TIGR02574 family)
MRADVPDFDNSADPDVEEAWDAEILRRIEEMESGTVEGIPWSEVRKRLFRDLTKD